MVLVEVKDSLERGCCLYLLKISPGSISGIRELHQPWPLKRGETRPGKKMPDVEIEKIIYREIDYGSFERRFVLPEGVKADELKAKFTNGILEITMPAPAVSKARKIEIEAPKEEKKLIETEAKKAA